MEKHLKLTTMELLEKRFNIDFKGYCAEEVDEFLDIVIQDYQEYDEMIQSLTARLQEYESKVAALSAKISELEAISDLAQEIPAQSNLDILKRLTRLENEVFRQE